MSPDQEHVLLADLWEAVRRATVYAALVKETTDPIPLAIHRRALAKWKAEIRRLVAAMDAVEAAPDGKRVLQ